MLDDIDTDSYDMVITPGGRPGAEKLANDQRVTDLIAKQIAADKYVSSICASPIALEAAGITKDLEGTCYPGFEDQVHYKTFHEDITYYDENHKSKRVQEKCGFVYHHSCQVSVPLLHEMRIEHINYLTKTLWQKKYEVK